MQNLGIWGVSALRDNAKDFQYGVFPFPYLPTASKERFAVDGPSSPMRRAKIPRKRQSSVFGQWVPCRTIPFKESLTGVPRRTVGFAAKIGFGKGDHRRRVQQRPDEVI
jgi:hypothetical protein